jgi:hypothetical protein
VCDLIESPEGYVNLKGKGKFASVQAMDTYGGDRMCNCTYSYPSNRMEVGGQIPPLAVLSWRTIPVPIE